MNGSLVIAPVVLSAALALAACGGGSDDASDTTATHPESHSGSHTMVTVDGKDLTGVDLSHVGCTRQGDSIVIGSGGSSGGVGATLKAGDPPTVQAVAITVDGTALAVGPGVGEAKVAVDGKTYTITGKAQGGSLSNVSAGIVTKEFEIMVTCD